MEFWRRENYKNMVINTIIIVTMYYFSLSYQATAKKLWTVILAKYKGIIHLVRKQNLLKN